MTVFNFSRGKLVQKRKVFHILVVNNVYLIIQSKFGGMERSACREGIAKYLSSVVVDW